MDGTDGEAIFEQFNNEATSESNSEDSCNEISDDVDEEIDVYEENPNLE